MNCPLTKAMLAEVRRSLALAAELEPHLKAAEAAGFDVAEQRLRLDGYQKSAAAILTVYEPIVLRECGGGA